MTNETSWRELLADCRSVRGAPAFPFVTISRQAGAGGHRLAEEIKKAAETLTGSALFQDWRVLDRDLAALVLEDTSFHTTVDALLAEEYHSEWQEFLSNLVGGPTEQFAIYKKIFGLMWTLARRGKVVLVGRAGCCATRELPGGIHLRLVASRAARVKRMADLSQLDAAEAGKIADQQDRDRARLMRTFFDRDIDDASLYHGVFDTDQVPLIEITTQVLDMVRDTSEALK